MDGKISGERYIKKFFDGEKSMRMGLAFGNMTIDDFGVYLVEKKRKTRNCFVIFQHVFWDSTILGNLKGERHS